MESQYRLNNLRFPEQSMRYGSLDWALSPSGVSSSLSSIVDWLNFIREVFVLNATFSSTKIGEENKIVEIDESKFGVRIYHKGRHVDGSWVFGGVERGSNMFMVIVHDWSAQTLLQVIHENILPGSTIISDCWKSYNKSSSILFLASCLSVCAFP